MTPRHRAESNPELRSLPVFFLDLQTTGSTPASGEILEMGWKGSREPISSPQNLILRPSEPLPRRIRLLTGIRDEELETAVSHEAARSKLASFLREENYSHAVIHYARFETPFLESWGLDSIPPFEILCSFEIARRLLPNLPSRGIQGLAGYFGHPGKELKRATSQVLATETIWNGLLSLLEERKILRLSELQDFLASPVPKKTKHEYRITAEKRLALPTSPGIYRMLGKNGEVLYVGKATSLRDRVNSYFRGRKGRDSRKLVMLTQVWDLEVVECGSPLEAALLEVNEIKRWDPPYNVSLKRGDRRLTFYSRDFNSSSEHQDEIHRIGPFPNAFTLDWIFRLVAAVSSDRSDPVAPDTQDAVQAPRFTETFFYDPQATDLIESGWQVFLNRHGFTDEDFSSPRKALARALEFYRDELKLVPLEELEDEVAELEQDQNPGNEQEDRTSEALDEEETPEEMADRFERYLIGSGSVVWKAKLLTRLLDREVFLPSSKQVLRTSRAKVVISRAEGVAAEAVQNSSQDISKGSSKDSSEGSSEGSSRGSSRGSSIAQEDPLRSSQPAQDFDQRFGHSFNQSFKQPLNHSLNRWQGLTIDDYDRMSVLNSELKRALKPHLDS
jgi:DNA polymerase-3 subunit epsilon